MTKSDIISFHCSEMISYHFTVELSDKIGSNKLIEAIGLHVILWAVYDAWLQIRQEELN